MTKTKKTIEYIVIITLAGFSALNYAIFIFPNSFAPAGLDGLCTMVQDITNINIGYLSLIVNIPLILISYKYIEKDFAIKTILFILSFSVTSALIDIIDISNFEYYTDTHTSTIFAPIIAGVIRGIIYAITIAFNGSSGGFDIIGALIRIKKPHFNYMSTIFVMNLFVCFLSYFVYGHHLEPVICGILYFYIVTNTSNKIQTTKQETVKFEIITTRANELCQHLTNNLNLSATILDAHGAYSGKDNKMVVCITDKKTSATLEKVIKNFENTVFFESIVSKSSIK